MAGLLDTLLSGVDSVKRRAKRGLSDLLNNPGDYFSMLDQ
jgi:hypothetical protein